MIDKHDYKAALSLGPPFPQRTTMTEEQFLKYRAAVEHALAFAHKMMQEPSEGMKNAGEQALLMPKLLTGEPLGSEMAEAIATYNAMRDQALREIEAANQGENADDR